MATDETRIVGNLPNLRMEIVHRQEPDGTAEHMTIHVTAVPSFQAAESLLLGGLGGTALLSGMGGAGNPMALWANMAQAAMTSMMAPWSQLMSGANPWAALLPGAPPTGRNHD